MPNHLIKEHSPYLKQHAQNPVAWYPWTKKALEKAVAEEKLIIVSIGYSACHWCHVMERESFEDEEVAAVMNEHYVSIKVDREERPDIDQIYMTAVQLMTERGGWPLNCICLPDGRPVYGGTYFSKTDWLKTLQQVQTLWHEHRHDTLDFADKLVSAITNSESLTVKGMPAQYTRSDLQDIISPWIKRFDSTHGGYKRSPKFPLPNNWLFLLRYGYLEQEKQVLDHTHFTLLKMASGGVYDQVGGGFARYAVDERWHIPHFEKMLYDNAQLVSLYTEAYVQRPTPLYKTVVQETLAWIKREMTNESGAFYCALDADSEGVEGKFYTFTKDEFDQVLGADSELFSYYFNITAEGNWEEEGTNVLYVDDDAHQLIADAGFDEVQWGSYLQEVKGRLRTYREQRVRPALDNKVLTSWNAMMLKALLDAYQVFKEDSYYDMALKNAAFIEEHLFNGEGVLLRQPVYGDRDREIPAFLDDHAFLVEAYISFYECTFDIEWLNKARLLADYVLEHFYSEGSAAFFYTADNAEELIARKYEIADNVIPASNSVMVRQLHKLGMLFDHDPYKKYAASMLANVFPDIKAYGAAYSNWSIRLLEEIVGLKELAITGEDISKEKEALLAHYIPNKILMGGREENLPLLRNRVKKETQVFVCENNTCSLPVLQIDDALKLILNQEA